VSKQSVTTNLVWATANHVVGRGSIVLASMLLARSLATNEFAKFGLFQISVTMIASYGQLGMGVAASRFFAETGTDRSVAGSASHVCGAILLVNFIAACAGAVFVLVAPLGWVTTRADLPSGVLALGVAAAIFSAGPSGAIVGLERFRAGASAGLLSALVMIVGSLWAASVGSVVCALWAFVSAQLVQTAVEMVILVRTVGWRSLLCRNELPQSLRMAFGFSGPMILVSMLVSLGNWVLGVAILNGNGGTHGFAVFTIGMQWYGLGLFVPGMMSRVLMPRLVRVRNTDSSEASKTLKQGLVISILSASLICVFGLLFSRELAGLYGVTYKDEHIVMAAFLIAAMVAAPTTSIGNSIVARDGQRVWLALTFAWFLCISLGSWFGAEWSAAGGALCLIASASVLAALAAISARRMGCL